MRRAIHASCGDTSGEIKILTLSATPRAFLLGEWAVENDPAGHCPAERLPGDAQ
jgi:hypothetical protein